MNPNLLTFFVVIFAAGSTTQSPVKSPNNAEGAGKQVVELLRVRGRKPMYKLPPGDEAYKVSAWEMMKFKPKKIGIRFDRLFANHPDIKRLNPAEDEPQVIAEEIAKLRQPDNEGYQKAFTASIKRYLENSNASQQVKDTVLGHNRRVRNAFTAHRGYQRKVSTDDERLAMRRRKASQARIQRSSRKDYADEKIHYISKLSAQFGGGSAPAAILGRDSQKILQSLPRKKGTLILKEYMKLMKYEQRDVDEVLAIRARQSVAENNKKMREKYHRKKEASEAKGEHMSSPHQEVVAVSRPDDLASRLTQSDSQAHYPARWSSEPHLTTWPSHGVGSKSAMVSTPASPDADEDWFQSLFN